jgi:DNA processing protein
MGDECSQVFQLSNRQRLDWLQLIRSENVGPATFRDLINHFGTASDALDALPELSSRAGKKSIKICPRSRAEAEIVSAARLNVQYTGMGEAEYPRYLKSIDYPPPLLSIRGKLPINQHPPIAMVGARNSSASGLKLAAIFAGGLGEIPYHIVSGFARGIDAAAHRAALETGTIAVLAGGVNDIYPPEHDKFYSEILETGNAFVSEMPLGYRPRATDFPRRNRIIAGIALGVIVIEASKRSGSLITARLSNEAGRLVFAVPGSPLDPRSAGANSLLKKGAMIASEPADIVEEISSLLEYPLQEGLFRSGKHSLKDDEKPGINNNTPKHSITDTSLSNRQAIIEALGPTPVGVDELVRHCRLPVSDVQLVLIELSLARRLDRHPGNKVSLIMDG